MNDAPLTVTSYASGELLLTQQGRGSLRLTQEQAHRLILAARMHTVTDFVKKLPQLISEPSLAGHLATLFQTVQGSNRWNLKEKLARLRTVTKGYPVSHPEEVVEMVQLHS